MSTIKEIENAIGQLSLQEKEAIRDWLDEVIEDQLEISDEFKAKVARAQDELAAGIYSRTRQPNGRE